jgi:hypothetical protein
MRCGGRLQSKGADLVVAAENDRPLFTPRRVAYALAALASVLFLASIIFDADAYTGLSGRPSTQRATIAW